jgi:pSer/pThr/pTyr-binding forkhead associated (FHA) protein
MPEIIFTIQSPQGSQKGSLTKDRLTIGRNESADIAIDDMSLSPVQCSIHRQDEKVWILDENSKTGCFVNGKPVAALGTPLTDGDEITLGSYITVWVSVISPETKMTSEQTKVSFTSSPVALIAGSILLIFAVVGIATFAAHMLRRESRVSSVGRERRVPEDSSGRPKEASNNSSNTADKTVETHSLAELPANSNVSSAEIPEIEKRSAPRKSYLKMTEEEQNEFIYVQARNISRMMSNREYVFTDDVLPYIKKYVDGYARRVGNNSTAIWGEDLTFLFSRARRLAPDIIREFNARGTPKIVGLYIPMIESEYRECLTSPVGAKGLFQFMPATARGYGVDPEDRCNVKRMAPAAAKYIKDRMTEFGSDAMSVALGIAGYNRSPDSVRRDLSDVLNSKNKERSFWTLIANSEKLDHYFQNENIKYVPKFFAAAIVGENPWAFGLEMNPLSTYTAPPSPED